MGRAEKVICGLIWHAQGRSLIALYQLETALKTDLTGAINFLVTYKIYRKL